MLNLFPSLLSYSFAAIAVIRLALGIVILTLGSRELLRHNRRSIRHTIGSLQFLGGVTLILGIYTQVVVIVLSLLMFIQYQMLTQKHIHSLLLYVLTITVLLVMLAIGPGMFALDLPL